MTEPTRERSQRRRPSRRRRQRRSALLVVVFLVVAGAGLAWGLTAGRGKTTSLAATAAATTSVRRAPVGAVHARAPFVLSEHVTGSLDAPLQDPASAIAGGGGLLLGGLTAADTSSSSILYVTARGDRPRGSLPTARHDTAAVTIGGAVYLFGGGDGTKQLDEILRIDPATGRVTAAGQPAGGELGLRGGGGRRHRLRRRRVHRDALARHDRRLEAWRRRARRRAPAEPGALRRCHRGRRDGRDRRRLAPDRDGERRGARLRPGLGLRPPARDAARPDDPCRGRGDRRARVRDRRPRRQRGLRDRPDRLGRSRSRGRSVRRAGSTSPAPTSPRSASAAGSCSPAGAPRAGPWRRSPSSCEHGPPRLATGRIPPLLSKTNVYAADGANMLSPAVAGARSLVYVPNSVSDTVDVVDPKTYKIVAHYPVGGLPQHVVPVVGPAHAVRHERHRQQPHADRPEDREAEGPADPGG